jgi:hypothetical protein
MKHSDYRDYLVSGEINATALQVRRAYEYLFYQRIPDDIPFSEIARKVILELGFEKAKACIEGQSDGRVAVEPLIQREVT